MTYKSSENNILNLSNKSLKKVPKSILKNINLIELDLSNNELTALPSFITELKYLEVLKLRNNKIKVPPELILQFKNLKTLYLSENYIEVIPESFSRLSKLENFDIGSNPLIEFPKWIDKLYALKDLGIYDLKLKHLPNVVTHIRSLEILSLDENDLITLPDSIGYLKELKELWAEGNCFEYLPESFGNLTKLEQVNFGVNKIKYLPESICNLRKLVSLSVSENELCELPTNIGNLSKLTHLNIGYNKIVRLPLSFSRLNIKNLEVWFDGNNYDETNKKQIKSLFPEIEDRELNSLEPINVEALIIEQNEDEVLESSDKESLKEDNSLSISSIYLIIFAVVFIIIIIFMKIYSEWEEDGKKEIIKNYETALTLHREKYNNLLKKNKYIYVYTNDTVPLRVTLKQNKEIYTNTRSYQNTQSKTVVFYKYLNDNGLEFNVVLDNNRVQLIQAHIYDSVYTKESKKKYSLVVDYKMSEQEIKIKKKHQSKYTRALTPDKDSIFNSEKTILTSKELTDKKISNVFKKLFAPIIDLNNKEYHFYFSSNSNNCTKQEFIKAIENFKIMFLKTDKNIGKIKKLILEKDTSLN